MKHLLVCVAIVAWISLNQQGWAADTGSPNPPGKRHTLKDCMIKQMMADRTLSYNAALKTCNERLKPAGDGLLSSNRVKP